MAERTQLTACKTCRTRKRPCDKAVPRCALCVKADTPCTFVDTASGEEYSRQQIADLEHQEAELRAELSSTAGRNTSVNATAVDQNNAQSPRNAAPAEGSNVLETILSNPRFHPQRLRQLLVRPQILQPVATPAEMPHPDVGHLFFDNYFKESHVQRPMLQKSEVQGLLRRAYPEGRPGRLDSQDSYVFFLICAISAVRLRRQGLLTQHPYSFFLSALRHAEHTNLLSGIIALQNLLLLNRFAVYYHTGVSTWDIGRICMHLCITLELHLKPLVSLSSSEEQHRRILFWESYVTDRHMSTILGRPFAIADEDIEVDLPAALSGTELEGFGGLAQPRADAVMESHMAVFIAFIKLRQISSRIQTTFFAKTKRASAQLSIHTKVTVFGELLDIYQKLSEEIKMWRESSPIYFHAETFYQMQEWYEFLAEKEQLFLVRGAIDAIHSKTGSRPTELCDLCCSSASKVIHLYSGLYWTKQINCTRHYFQILFIAGLLLAYFSTNEHPDHSDTASAAQDQETMGTLMECHRSLQSLGHEMQDALPYAKVFGLICGAAFPNWTTYESHWQTLHANDPDMSRRDHLSMDTFSLPSGLNNAAYGDFDQAGMYHAHDTWPDMLTDWTYSPGHLFADMEAYVGQFATGDFTWDPLLNPLSWNISADGIE
ncbi:unnamed protein product [Cercospora beticola]|nr:unnamed protein product [Cercospora beticola]